MARYTIIDTESWWDEALHNDYCRLDPSNEKRRIACRLVGVAAAMDIEVTDDGHVSLGSVSSWSAHDLGSSERVVEALIDNLRARERSKVVTFGGVAVDMPIITLAAMAAGMPLPMQLRAYHGPWINRPHIDLGLALKSGGKTWHHLSEVALAIGLPVNLLEGKARVDAPCSAAAWEAVRGHCERDLFVTAAALIAWKRAQGVSGLRLPEALYGLTQAFLRRRPEHPARAVLTAYADDLLGRIGFADLAA